MPNLSDGADPSRLLNSEIIENRKYKHMHKDMKIIAMPIGHPDAKLVSNCMPIRIRYARIVS